MATTSPKWQFTCTFNEKKVRLNKFSFLVRVATLRGLATYMWLIATALDRANM